MNVTWALLTARSASSSNSDWSLKSRTCLLAITQ